MSTFDYNQDISVNQLNVAFLRDEGNQRVAILHFPEYP
jgi:hypothetical protein